MNENVLTRTELELTLTLGSLTARHGRPGAFVELQPLSDATGGMILRVSSTDGLEWSSSHTSLVSMGSPLPRVALDYPGLTRLRNGVRAAADLCGWVRLRADEHTLQLLADGDHIPESERILATAPNHASAHPAPAQPRPVAPVNCPPLPARTSLPAGPLADLTCHVSEHALLNLHGTGDPRLVGWSLGVTSHGQMLAQDLTSIRYPGEAAHLRRLEAL